MLRRLMLVATLCAAGPLGAVTLEGQQTYDLLFRSGTLDEIGRDKALVYTREVRNSLKPEAADRDTGEIALLFSDTEEGIARLEFRQDGRHRGMGKFPASVGNPMIMMFYESVIRDMAESAGGSPFYIRNRVKEALVQPSEVIEGEVVIDGETVPTRTIRLYPFRDDPNADRMQGFGALELEVTMSEAVPGWYMQLVADVPAEVGGEGPVYHSVITFDALRAGGGQ
jgi:hypothetical protein